MPFNTLHLLTQIKAFFSRRDSLKTLQSLYKHTVGISNENPEGADSSNFSHSQEL